MHNKHPLLERLVSALTHLISLTGVLYLILNLIGFPLFPTGFYYFLIPNLLILGVALFWSRYVLSHTAQALTLQALGLLLATVPWIMRQVSRTGVLGERWFYTGWGGNSNTAWWSLMTIVLAFGGLALFTLCCEAAVQAFNNQEFRYPLLGRLTARLFK